MKKFILTLTAVAVVGLGSGPAFAQDDPEPLPDVSVPANCAESDDRGKDTDGNGVAEECDQFYPPTTEETTTTAKSISPPTTPPTDAVDPPEPPEDLPRTGSGISSTMGIGAVLLLVGGLAMVAARRRSTATS